MAPIFGYWDIRGLGNPIRMLLHYADVRYEEKQYRLKLNDQEGMDEWFKKDKPALQETLDFPNLPYYIDGLVQLTHSKAILQYLGRKHGLDGTNDQELNRMSLIMEQMVDYQNSIGKIAYANYTAGAATNMAEVHETLRKEYAASLPEKFALVSKFLGTNQWVAGDKLTYVDFYVYDILDFHRILYDPKHLNAFPTLVQYMERFENLKGVKEFLSSPDKFKRLPIWSPYALNFGNSSDYKPFE